MTMRQKQILVSLLTGILFLIAFTFAYGEMKIELKDGKVIRSYFKASFSHNIL